MPTIDDLFDNGNAFDIDMFHDAVISPLLAYNFSIATNIDTQALRDIYHALPAHIQSIAENFGLNDTEFRNEVCGYIEEGIQAFRYDVLRTEKKFGIGYAYLEGKDDLVMVDVFVNTEDEPPYIRIPMMRTPEMDKYLSTTSSPK